jgi:hypothetical protein
MISRTNAEELIRQTKRYEFSDGLRDLQLAMVLSILGVILWLTFDLVYVRTLVRLMYTLGAWVGWLSILMIVIVIPVLVTSGVHKLTTRVRQRWLWRESGMVESLPWLVPRWVTMFAVAIYLIAVVFSLRLHFAGQVDTLFVLRMLVVAAAWSTGVTLVGFGLNIGLPRYVWLGVIGGLGSTFFLFLPLTFGQTALVFGLSWGFTFAVSGIIALRRTLFSLQRTHSGG